METTNNLPSLFRSLRTSCHSPLISTAELERLILHDKALENDTKGYREAINIDRNEARNKKRRLPAICPSIQFRRTGRKLEDFGCATGWLMLDYDHVAEIGLDEKVELASKSPYSMVGVPHHQRKGTTHPPTLRTAQGMHPHRHRTAPSRRRQSHLHLR